MPYHIWGDDWFEKNGDDLYHAINYITEIWEKDGRINVSSCKEKYGTFRDHSSFWDGTLYNLLYPNRYFVEWNYKVYKYLDNGLFRRFTTWSGIAKLYRWYQSTVYNYAIQTACIQWPHIQPEILSDLARPDLIKPGRFGNIDGVKEYRKYWKNITEDDESEDTSNSKANK